MHNTAGATQNTAGEKRQKLYAFAFAYILSFLPLNICINALTTAIGLNTGLDTLLFYGALWFFVLYSLANIILKDNITTKAIGFIVFFVIVYAISALSDENARYMFGNITNFAGNPLYITFIYTIPIFIITLSLKNAEILTRVFKAFSYVVVACSVAVYFLLPDSSATQYMSLSYNMLAQLVFLAIHKPEKWKFLHYALLILGVFVVFFGGARGAAIGLIVGISIFLIGNKGNSAKKTVLIVLIMLALVFALIFLDKIVLFLQQILQSLGIKSRTFDFLISGIQSDSDITSGRMTIYERILSNVQVLGGGFFSDRVLLEGSYSHNLFLEILLDFGWLFGIPVCLTVVVILLSGLFSTQSTFWKFVVVTIPTGFVSAMLSGSFLAQFPAIYALIALCLVARKEQKEVS